MDEHVNPSNQGEKIADAPAPQDKTADSSVRIAALEAETARLAGELAGREDALATVKAELAETLSRLRQLENGLDEAENPHGARAVWLLFFEDTECPSELFAGEGAMAAARRRYDACRLNWNCHLLTNSVDNSEQTTNLSRELAEAQAFRRIAEHKVAALAEHLLQIGGFRHGARDDATDEGNVWTAEDEVKMFANADRRIQEIHAIFMRNGAKMVFDMIDGLEILANAPLSAIQTDGAARESDDVDRVIAETDSAQLEASIIAVAPSCGSCGAAITEPCQRTASDFCWREFHGEDCGRDAPMASDATLAAGDPAADANDSGGDISTQRRGRNERGAAISDACETIESLMRQEDALSFAFRKTDTRANLSPGHPVESP